MKFMPLWSSPLVSAQRRSNATRVVDNPQHEAQILFHNSHSNFHYIVHAFTSFSSQRFFPILVFHGRPSRGLPRLVATMLPLVHIVAALFLLVIETVQAVLNSARLLSAMDLLGRELVIIVAAVVVLIPLGHVAGFSP